VIDNADDVKMYVRIVNDVNLLLLPHAIDSLLKWAEEGCVLNIGHLVMLPKLMIQNKVLPNVNSVRDLGKMLQITCHRLTMYVTLPQLSNMLRLSIDVLFLVILICLFVLLKCMTGRY